MSLTKQTIIETISEELDLKPSQAKDIIEDLLEIIKSTLASGEDIMISGFGKFQVNEKAPRKGRNPTTGQDILLKGRRGRIPIFPVIPPALDCAWLPFVSGSSCALLYSKIVA